MRASKLLTALLTVGACLAQGGPALAQGANISDAECQSLRQRLAEHARLSDGVRRAVAAQAGAAPATPAVPAPSAPPAASRADAIRARLEQIPKERQTLEDQRLGALVKFEMSRAGQIQGQIQALDTEKANLERELAALPSVPTVPSAPTAATPQPAAPDVARIRCQDMPTAVDNAVKTRRRELGAREEQAGAIPLISLKGQTPVEIGKELAGQFSTGPTASTQVGLLDADGDGRLDGFVDVPAPGVFRLFRLKADGTVSLDVFPAPGSAATPAYGEPTRRLDETMARQSGQALPELVATRPAGPFRGVTQTAEFEQAYAQFEAGNFTEAARLTVATARSEEFQNLRGQSVRVIEIMSPVPGGVSLRRVVVLGQPNDQELWEETTTIVRPVSYLRTDVEVARSRATRTTGGAVVGTPSVSAPSKFALER
ncbi:MAG TPA: hypothetical protein VMT97_06670 [Terriglobales bacterium]|nr:hypothetical protein [Terriglobales bacterium]